MIRTRSDLSYYISQDAAINDVNPGLFWYWAHLVAGSERAHAFRYLKCLRHCEYHLNNTGILHSVLFLFYSFRKKRMGLRYGISIPDNTVGYAFRILHMFGGGFIINCRRMGNHCAVNAGVLVGNKDSQENVPDIGDYVALGPGVKVIGKVTIGTNVFVGANSVVVDDIPGDSIAVGVPARVIKGKEKRK